MTIFYDYVLDELRLKDVPDGSGGFWGSFYDTTTQTAGSTTVAYPITLNTTSGSNGVAIGSPTSRVVFTYAGVYSITFSIQFENSSSDDHRITTWLKKNGTDITDSSSITSIPKSHGADNGAIITTINYVIQLQAGDYLETYWQTESTAVSIKTIPAGTTPTTPLSPSIIFTAVQGGIITQGSTSNSLASLTDVSFTSLASGQIIMSNASGNWSNVTFPAIPSIPSLGSLAVMNQLSFTSLTNQPSLSSLAFQSTIDYNSAQLLNKPSLGSLAVMNQLSFTSLTNQPSLGSLAFQDVVQYSQVTGVPSLGSLAVMNQLSFTSLTNQPSLGSIAFQNTVDYSQLTNTPSLGSLAVMNQLSFTSLLNQPSLSSLAFQSTVDYSQITGTPSLGSLAIMNQLSFTSLTNQPSLSSLAFQSTIDYTSAQLTNKPSLGSLAVMNQLSFTSLTNQPSLGSLAVLNGPLPANSPASTNRFVTAYNSTTGAFTIERPTWQNIDKTTSPIDDLSDVTISGALDGQVLTYELSSTSWKNKKLPTQSNILENANHINNSTNGYGGLSDGWSENSANTVQGGFPYLEWDSVFSPGATTAFWYLNEASGNAIDGKTGTYPLTDTNTVGSDEVIGLMDYSRNFNGTNMRFSGTVALGNVAGSQTFVAFVRPGQVTTLQHIAGYNDGTRSAYLGISATGKPFFNFTGTTPTIVTADVSCEIGKWYLIIGSYDSASGQLRIFVNGVYKAVSCTGTHVVTTNSIFQIGATNSANHFTGRMNAVAHYYEKGWDEEQCLSLFAVSIYKNARIMRENTSSEISCYQLLGREQMHRFANQQVIFSAEVYQTNSSNAKLTIYDGSSNNDSNIVTTTGSWQRVSVVYTFSSAPAEVYFNLRSSSGTRGAMYYRNIKLNYGGTAIGDNIHNEMDWIKFPRLLMLDIPKMFDGEPYQYEENRWYSWTPTLAPVGTSNVFTTEWRFSGKTCTIKGYIQSTHTSTTWTHTLPIRTGASEVIYSRFSKIQNNAGTVALGNWVQTTGNSTTASMYSSIANAVWNTVSGVKVAQLEMIEWEID